MDNAKVQAGIEAERQRKRDWTLLVMLCVTLAKARATYYGLMLIATVIFPKYWMIWAGMVTFLWVVWKIDNDDGSDVWGAISRCRPKR